MSFGRIEGFTVKDGIFIALIFIFVSAAVSIFNSFFYTSRFSESKAAEIGQLFNEGTDFSKTAKQLLSTRKDISSIKLLDPDGILKESFGDATVKGGTEYSLSTPDKSRVIVTLKEADKDKTTLPALLFSILIGSVLGVCLLMALLMSSGQNGSLEKLIAAMKRVARGDVSAKLEVEDPASGSMMTKVFESFNSMTEQLRRRTGFEEYAIEPEPIPDEPVPDMPVTPSESQPKFLFSEQPAKKENEKLRRVVALVAKLSNFEELSATLGPSKLTSFLTEYRKSASSIISDYGGFTETLLQDEIIALFNVPDKQDKPELRAICAAVEVLQSLADIGKKRKIASKNNLTAKVGIDAKSLTFNSEFGIPGDVNDVITLAKGISENAPNWKVLVSSGIYIPVTDYVQVKEVPLGDEKLYSIVSVEEGVIEI